MHNLGLIQRLLLNRNASVDELTQINSLHNLLRPELIKGMDKAISRLVNAFEQQQSVVIVGDYDVDGATSTALAVRALTAMGLKQVQYVIPNRMIHGYGLSPDVINLARVYNPQLLITVDNGTSSISGVDYANTNNIDVIITDHHLPAETLPSATAIINPNQTGCQFPEKSLAGVGVCFYLMIALRKQLRNNHWFNRNNIEEPNLAKWLDLVALGTVADLVPLKPNNRLLVNMGIKLLRSGKGNSGIHHLYTLAKNQPIQQLQVSDLGFSIAPRLNAAGRIDDMSIGIECLLSDSEPRVQALAMQLNEINLQRRQLQGDASEQARNEVTKLQLNTVQQALSISLYQPHWHQGIVGLVASSIKEQYYRPTIVFAKADENSAYLKGSGRSIEGYHIRDALVWIDTRYPKLIEHFGGHAMAAGLTIKKEKLEQFTDAFEQCVAATLEPGLLKEKIINDGALASEDITLDHARTLEEYVWGQQFPAPLFDNSFSVVEQRLLAEKHLRLELTIDSKCVSAIWFNVPEPILQHVAENPLASIDCYYQLQVNRFHGDDTLQLQIIKVKSWN